MPGRKFVSGEEYRFGFNGVEKSPEISEGHNTTFFREMNTRIARWWSNDPIVHENMSPYNMMDNNPIAGSDALGSNTESTHLDKDGNVVAAYNDGDNGVYRHNSLDASTHSDGAKAYVDNLREAMGITSGGGERVGSTLQPYDYMTTDDRSGEFYFDPNFQDQGPIQITDNLRITATVKFFKPKKSLTWKGWVDTKDRVLSREESIYGADGIDLVEWGKKLFTEEFSRSLEMDFYNALVILKGASSNGAPLDFKVSLGAHKYQPLQVGISNDGLPIITTLRAVGNITPTPMLKQKVP